MKVILIITSSIDYTVDYLILKYGQNIRMLRLNVDMLDKYYIDISKRNWKISTQYWSVSKDEIFSIYYRKPRLPDLSCYEDSYHFMIQRDIIATITGLVDSFDGIVLTKPSALRKTENKIFQIQKSHEVGFITPETLITNHTKNAAEFINNKETIIKPITTGKIQFEDKFEIYQTNIINKISDDIGVTPIYLQEYIIKFYEVRLTVITKDFFSIKCCI